MSIPFPNYDYRSVYLGELMINNSKLELYGNYFGYFKLEHNGRRKEIMMPINPLGTYASRIPLEGYEKIFRELKDSKFINTEKRVYPVLFVKNAYYGYPKDVEYVAGVSFDLEEEKIKGDSIIYILGYSISSNKDNIAATNAPKANKKIFFSLIVNKILFDKIKNFSGLDVKVITTDGKYLVSSAESVRKWIMNSRDVKAYLRQTPLIPDLLTNDMTESAVTKSGSLELIHLGSQISGRAYLYSESSKKWNKRKLFYIHPAIIPFSFIFPVNHKHTPLPKDTIVDAFVLDVPFMGLDWQKVEKLVDWLFLKHKESLIKILLNRQLLVSLVNILSNKFIYIKSSGVSRKIYGLEIDINARLYQTRLKFLSPSLGKILEIYNSLSVENSLDIVDLIISMLKPFLDENNVLSKINIDKIDKYTRLLLKKSIGVFALTHGLHGASHLIMKVLSDISGLDLFGERIIIRVKNDQSPHFSSLIPQNDTVVENTFQFKSGNDFRSDVIVFAKKSYTYEYVRDALQSLGSSIDQIMRDELRIILAREGSDACERNFEQERRLLKSARNLILSSIPRGNDIDNVIRNYINNRIPASRTLSRFLFDHYIRSEIKSELNPAKNEMPLINRLAQFSIPYYVPQCVDGCYNCVLVPRNVGQGMCDMSPLEQEMKISKWAALCLLKYKGWVDYPWVDCDLS